MKKKFIGFIELIKRYPFTAALILVAALCHLLIILPNGSHYCFNGNCGDYFWGVHEHDGIWHVAVAESAFKTFPPRNPVFSGSVLSGYNSLLDFIIFTISLTGLSSLFIYFKVLPIVWFIFFTYCAIRFSKKIKKNNFFMFTFLFLSYFGASFSFIIPLIKNNTITGTSSLLSMQAILTLTNLQLAFSYIFLLLVLTILYDKQTTKKQVLILSFYIFIQWGLKFYAGFITTIIVGIVFLMRWVREKDKKYYFYIILFGLSTFVSLMLNYNPFGQLSNGGAPFQFNPLALIWPLIEDPSMFYSRYWANAKYILLASSKISPRLLALMVLLTVVYIVLNLGPRIIGFFVLIKENISKKSSDLDRATLSGILLSFIFPILFVQKGVWWNTVQFLFPILFLLNIHTAEYISNIRNRFLGYLLLIIIIGTSLPYSIDALRGYIKLPGNINISDNQKKALVFLKNLPDGVIYTPLYKPNIYLNKGNSVPLFNHVDSAYISAYTGKQSYYSDITQLLLLNSDYKKRKEQIEIGACSIILDIQYVYIIANQTKDLFFKKCVVDQKSFIKIYDNGSIFIYSKIK